MYNFNLLLERLTEARADGREVTGPDALAEVIMAHARDPVILEDHPWLRATALPLIAQGTIKPCFLAELSGPPAWIPEVDTAVTIAEGAIPETGSLIINAHSPLAFRLSLRPRCHIVLVAADRAGLTLTEALEWTARESSHLVTWITGPSRTADIEKVLVLGAQGARELVVVLYRE
jgi:L-lactate dehydrogenase complex protein LldG